MSTEVRLQRNTAAARRTGLILIATCGAQFMLMIDDTVVNVALPTLGRRLGFSASLLPWVVDAFMIAFGGFMIFNGRIADLFGRKRMFVAGLVLFVSGSLAARVSSTAAMLVIARGVQGFAGALLAPAALGILAATFQAPEQRRKALGVWGAATGLSGIAGVLLGGIITGLAGWRWVFLINVPAGAVILAAIVIADPLNARPGKRSRLDLTGAILVSAGLATLVWGVLRATTHGWADTATVVSVVCAAALLVSFVFRETRVGDPIVELGLFHRRSFSAAIVCMFLAAAGMYSMAFFLTQYMQTVQGWSPVRTGVSWLSFGVLFMGATGLSIKLTPKIGTRGLILAGGLLGCAGQLMLLRTTVGGDYLSQLAPAIALMGAGIGLAFMPVYVTALHGHDTAKSSVVSALLATMQQVGGAVGVAVLASVAISQGHTALERTHDPRLALIDGFHGGFLVAAAFMAALAACAFLMPSVAEEIDMEAVQGL